MTLLKVLTFIAIVSVIYFLFQPSSKAQGPVQHTQVREIWPVRSIDTMKTSRDMAREKLNSPQYDSEIEKQVIGIKDLGANYIALGTPYDKEFLPYLKRWVNISRKHGLKIWYRGTFSAYEGWFDYPKDMSPEELLSASKNFIATNPDLFENGDIFDACPECENAGHWPQPQTDVDYNTFIQKKHQVLTESFQKLNKDVNVAYASIIGGRAKDVMDQKSFDTLGNVVALDHYTKSPANYGEYVRYFRDKHATKVLFSELGAPIPDLHGAMSEESQAKFLQESLQALYKEQGSVLGVNYWVYNVGTTSLVTSTGKPKKAVQVLEKYFKPGWLQGRITNTIGQGLPEASIEIDGGVRAKTNADGTYFTALPVAEHELRILAADHSSHAAKIVIQSGENVTVNTVLTPNKKSFTYKLQETLQKVRLFK